MLEKLTALNNHHKSKLNDSVFEDINIVGTEEEKQLLHFWEKRQVSSELSINVTILLLTRSIYWETITRIQLMTM